MQNQLNTIYKQIRDRQITPEDGAKRIKAFLAMHGRAGAQISAGAAAAAGALSPTMQTTYVLENSASTDEFARRSLEEQAIKYFKGILSSFFKLPVDRIDIDAQLEEYGIDSVIVMQLTSQLEKTFGPLSKTLFFEYRTTRKIADYFLTSFRRQMAEILGPAAQTQFTKDKDRINAPASSGQSIPNRETSKGNLIRIRPQLQCREFRSEHEKADQIDRPSVHQNSELESLSIHPPQGQGGQKSIPQLEPVLTTYIIKALEEAGRSEKTLTDRSKKRITAMAAQFADHIKAMVNLMADGQESDTENCAIDVRACANVGLRMITIPGEPSIPVALYYPTRSTACTVPMGSFSPTVALNGDPPEGVDGLILISHGAGGNEYGHHNIAQRLAQDGYLVAAPVHPGDNWRDSSLTSSVAYFYERPRHLSRVLDGILADPEWAGKIPRGCIGAIGHSAGGYSVLALLGAIADPLRLQSSHKPESEISTSEKDANQAGEVEGGSLKYSDDLTKFDVIDPRIQAAIALAPAAAVFDPESVKRIKVPLRIYGASSDTVLDDKHNAGWLHSILPESEYESVENAGHFAFMAQPNCHVVSEIGDPAENPDGFDRKEFHRRLENEVSSFFQRHIG